MTAPDIRGRYVKETAHASAAETANGSTVLDGDYGPAVALIAQLNVTAVAGTTPTLNVVIEDSVDGVNWNTIGTFTQKTGVSREVIRISTPFASKLRATRTIGGTAGPSFTYEIVVHAH